MLSFKNLPGSSGPGFRWFLALLLVSGLLFCPAVSAKSKDKGDAPGQEADQSPEPSPSPVSVSGDGSLGIGFGLSWADAGTGGGVDWVSSSSPSAGIKGDGSLDFGFRDLPWFSAGALWHGELNVSLDSKSPTANEPYLVIKDLDMEARMAFYLSLQAKSDDFNLGFRATLDGGLRVLDASDADYFYQPLTATGEDFWFRVLPLLGSGQELKVKIPRIMDGGIENQVLAWWDAETAYGRNWNPGFDDVLKGSVDFTLAKDKDFKWTLGTGGKASWKSRIIVPRTSAELSLRTGFEFDKAASIRLDLLGYRYEADMANFDSSLASNVLNQVYSRLEFRTSLGGALWGLSLSWPWQAWAADPSTPAAGEWEMKCSIDL